MEIFVINWTMTAVSSFMGSAYSKRSLDSLFNATPATLEAAQRHYQASRISKRTDTNDNQLKTEDVCECCKKRICGGAGARLFSLGDVDPLKELGLAFPLFFHLLRGICCMLLWVTLVASIGNIYYIYEHSGDPSDPNYNNDDTAKWPYILQLIALLGLFLMYVKLTFLLRQKTATLKKQILTEADYSVVIKNLGANWHSADLKQHIESKMLVNGKSCKVVKINTAYVLTDYMKIEAAVHKIKEKQFHAESITAEQMNSEKVALLKRVEELEKRTPEKVGVAVVTFHTIEAAAAFNSRWNQGLFKRLIWWCWNYPLYFAGRYMYVRNAYQPRDIVWKNLHIGRGMRILAQFITLILIIGAVVIIYTVLFFLVFIDVKTNSEDGMKGYLEKAPVSAVIFGVGLGIEKLAKLLARIEHHHSYSAHHVIIAYKLTIMQVANSVLSPLLFAYLTGRETLITQMHSLIVMNVFVKPVLRIFSISHVFSFLQRWGLSRKLKAGKCTLTQEAANETFQLPEIHMTIWYSDALTKFMLALMYTPLIPAAAPVFFIGFVLDYWAAKYALLRLAAMPAQLNEMLAMKMVKFVKFSILLYGIGMLMFYADNSVAISVEIIGFVLSLIYFIVPSSCYQLCYKSLRPSRFLKSAGWFLEECANFPCNEVPYT